MSFFKGPYRNTYICKCKERGTTSKRRKTLGFLKTIMEIHIHVYIRKDVEYSASSVILHKLPPLKIKTINAY